MLGNYRNYRGHGGITPNNLDLNIRWGVNRNTQFEKAA
jgi:hypothetical protein